jgi:hypothetical protein
MHIVLPTKHRLEVTGLGIPTGKTEVEEGLDAEAFSVDLRTLDDSKLDQFYAMLQKYPDARTARIHINSYRRARNDPKGQGKVDTMRAAAGALIEYLVDGATEGWVFAIDDNPMPALVTDVRYHPPVKRRDEESDPYIGMRMVRNNHGQTEWLSASITASKVSGTFRPEDILRDMGYQKETEELHELYQEQLVRFKEMRPLYGKQLVLKRAKTYEKREKGYRRSSFGPTYRTTTKRQMDLMKDNADRLVHDDPIKEGGFGVSIYRLDDLDNPWIDPGMKAVIERKLGHDTEAFSKSPHHMTFQCYHLGQHVDITVHVKDLETYQYDETIREKLVLPPELGEVLDVLTHDMLLVQEDVVEGKTGGNVILLAGPPGTGKTLTAEVYAEHRKTPLLKIHSGQLGTEPGTIEDRLIEFYKRATAWGIPVLLDEFDVFGRAREDNLVQNAVVAVFLRTLEYQNNTIFLTTNRHDIMDDAILSRCAAIIKYDYPGPAELRGIWITQRNQLLPSLKDEQIDELMTFFKEHQKQMSGRDVKQIMRLADRYERTGRPVSPQLLITAAGFRGV